MSGGPLYITSRALLRSNVAYYNGEVFVKSADAFSLPKELYGNLKSNYPKFYKMDNLCKVAFAASELLFKEQPLHQRYKEDEIALVFSNSGASLDTDKVYYKSVEDKSA